MKLPKYLKIKRQLTKEDRRKVTEAINKHVAYCWCHKSPHYYCRGNAKDTGRCSTTETTWLAVDSRNGKHYFIHRSCAVYHGESGSQVGHNYKRVSGSIRGANSRRGTGKRGRR